MTKNLTIALLILAACSTDRESRAQPPAVPPPASPSAAPSVAVLVPGAGGASPARDARVVCSFAWRTDVSRTFRGADRRTVELTTAHGTSTLRVGKVSVTLDHELRSGAPAPGLRIAVADDRGQRLLDDAYPFPGGALPENLPAFGHGFTGLSYLAMPDGTGELQLGCVVARPESPREDGWPSGVAGPAAPPGSHLVCDFALEAPGAPPLTRRLDLSSPSAGGAGPDRRASASTKLGPFAISVSHVPGNHEAGEAIIDVSGGAGGARRLYQTRGGELPAVFPGQRTHRAPTGEQLGYDCHASA
jgi:hypothetical protein